MSFIKGISLGLLAFILLGCSSQAVVETQIVVTEEAGETLPVITEEPTQQIENIEPTEQTVEQMETEEPSQSGQGKTYQIVPEESEARFLIDEVLLGEDFTVIGVTKAVSGEVIGNIDNPTQAQINVEVDARTFATDNNRRNGAIQRWILETSNPENQTVTFESTSISGLPEQAEVGQSYDLQITGDLTVKGVTNEITFDGSVTLISDNRLEGSFSTETLYTDYVTIPSLPPQVASVEDQIILEIDFVAVAN